ncbi:MAG: hypothetical protein ABI673_07650 [Novosphingobium sp.]
MNGNYILGAVIVGLMIMVVVSLVRGIVAFLQGSKEALDRAPGEAASEGPTASQLTQNKMMYARIKYQGLAILVVAIVLVVARSR